jgi:hypothetical protein
MRAHLKILVGGALFVGSLNAAASAAPIYAIDTGSDQQLLTFDSSAPETITSAAFITGLLPNERLVGIDFRPNDLVLADGDQTGELYAVGSASRIYTINLSTGAATLESTLPVLLSGTEYGIDFNPQPDRLRVVSNLEQNLRINVDTGATNVDGPLSYAVGDLSFGKDPSVTGVAYDRNDRSLATPTTLYGIDSIQNTLVRIGSPDATPVSPNTGQLFTVGTLGADTNQLVGFDIEAGTGIAYASLNTPGDNSSMFYTINLATGQAVPIGNIGDNDGTLFIRDIAVPIPEPTAVALLALAAPLLARGRRSR